MVEEETISRVREDERDRDIASRSVVDMAVPEPARRAESVEWLAALAETVEMLLSDHFEAKSTLGPHFDRRASKPQFGVASAIAEFKRGRTFGLPDEEGFAANCHVRTCGDSAWRRRPSSLLEI